MAFPPALSFRDLPVDVIVPILHMSTEISQFTYASLRQVCRSFKALVPVDWLETIPIMLCTLKQVQAFHAIVTDVGSSSNIAPRIRWLWLTESITKAQQKELGGQIAIACRNLISLACGPHTLLALLGSPGPFDHIHLKRLLLRNHFDWYRLVRSVQARDFFAQLTHFRMTALDVPTPSDPGHRSIPEVFIFSSLTHASYAINAPKELRFHLQRTPSLKTVIFTVTSRRTPKSTLGNEDKIRDHKDCHPRSEIVLESEILPQPRDLVMYRTYGGKEKETWKRGLLWNGGTWDEAIHWKPRPHP